MDHSFKRAAPLAAILPLGQKPRRAAGKAGLAILACLDVTAPLQAYESPEMRAESVMLGLAGLPKATICAMPDLCRTYRYNAKCSPFIFREP
ncbi:MAG: hypothetical protein EBT34_15715 [Acetobacteraceae bacterium]|nr:hypothetical protein [Acetobacteraceae bacterium]NBS45147.1 hypothetical protein [Acetobacteraceae bacterium]